MRYTKHLSLLSATLLTMALLTGCGNTTESPEVALTGEDVGIFYQSNNDGSKTIVDAGGNSLKEYELDSNGKVLKDGKVLLDVKAISEFIPARNCTIDIATEILLKPNQDRTAPVSQASAEVTIKIEPVNASSNNFFVHTVDKKIIKIGNDGETISVKTNEKGEATFIVTFVSTGTGSITVTDAATGEVIGKAFCDVCYLPDDEIKAVTVEGVAKDTSQEKSGVPVVTKNPTGVSVIPGNNAAFTSRATNTDKYEWYASSPDGQTTITAAKLTDYFKTMIVGGFNTDTLTLENIPSEMNGWKVKCAFSNSQGTTLSLEAKVLTVVIEPQRDTEVHVDTGNIVAAHTHAYSLEVVEPTATEKGYTLHYCTCGDKFCSDWTDPVTVDVHIHSYTVDTSMPGRTTYTCTGCGYTYSE